MRQDSYRCGWNDTAHGILHWTPHEKWQGPLEWALHMRSVAEELNRNKGTDDGYRQGVIEAVNSYQQTGRIARKEAKNAGSGKRTG